MDGQKYVGKWVSIIDKESIYFNHWGKIVLFDGESFHVQDGSISLRNEGITPIFDLDQLKIHKQKPKGS